MTKTQKGFNLIELVIVVAVIAILAAIAIPNFLEAQTRSKVARVKADQRVLVTAIESYATDAKSYPQCNAFALATARMSIPGDPTVLERLTTPVAYITSLPANPFPAKRFSGPLIDGLPPVDSNWGGWLPVDQGSADAPSYGLYQYSSTKPSAVTLTGIDRALVHEAPPSHEPADAFVLQSAGPMSAHINMGGVVANASRDYMFDLLYDPTNGTVSFGSIFRGGGTGGPSGTMYGAIMGHD